MFSSPWYIEIVLQVLPAFNYNYITNSRATFISCASVSHGKKHQLQLHTIPTGKDTCAFICFRAWITNSIHIHIHEQFWASFAIFHLVTDMNTHKWTSLLVNEFEFNTNTYTSNNSREFDMYLFPRAWYMIANRIFCRQVTGTVTWIIPCKLFTEWFRGPWQAHDQPAKSQRLPSLASQSFWEQASHTFVSRCPLSHQLSSPIKF